MHSKSSTRYHTPTHAVIMDYHFLLRQCHFVILSSISVHGKKLNIRPYLELKYLLILEMYCLKEINFCYG